ncbi:MAG: hypothetical protein AB7F96_02730 [Beijerinckiaceae bacterium]
MTDAIENLKTGLVLGWANLGQGQFRFDFGVPESDFSMRRIFIYFTECRRIAFSLHGHQRQNSLAVTEIDARTGSHGVSWLFKFGSQGKCEIEAERVRILGT